MSSWERMRLPESNDVVDLTVDVDVTQPIIYLDHRPDRTNSRLKLPFNPHGAYVLPDASIDGPGL